MESEEEEAEKGHTKAVCGKEEEVSRGKEGREGDEHSVSLQRRMTSFSSSKRWIMLDKVGKVSLLCKAEKKRMDEPDGTENLLLVDLGVVSDVDEESRIEEVALRRKLKSAQGRKGSE
jgi:hypothetical protein